MDIASFPVVWEHGVLPFLVEFIPYVTAVQRAALKELLIALALILVLRLMPQGLLPERIPRAPKPQTGETS